MIPFDIFESAQAAHVEGIQSIAIMDGQVPCLCQPCSNTEETRARYILILVCQEMQRRFHGALESLLTCGNAPPPPIARGQTWLFQPLSLSTVPNTGRNQSDSGYRGIGEDVQFGVELMLRRKFMCLVFIFHHMGTSLLWGCRS